MEREEIERAVEAFLAVSRASGPERDQVVRALGEALARIRDDEERLERTHSLVRLLLAAVPAVSMVRHLALGALRKRAEAEGDPDRWSHGRTAKRLGIDRASAASIAHGPRRKRSGDG